LRDLPAPQGGGDYLRRLESVLCSLPPDEIPFALAQLTAAFIVCCKAEARSRVKGADFVELQDDWYAIVVPSQSGISVPTCCQYTYGVLTRDIQLHNIESADMTTLLAHPDATVSFALLPLRFIPRPRAATYDYKYVYASVNKIVPVSVLKFVDPAAMWERAYFSSVRADRHGQNWFAVFTKKESLPVISVQQPGVLVGYRTNIVGYLSEEALIGAPSPWKAAPATITQTLPAPETPVEVLPSASAPQGEEEKI
jgi:hypothetical protein